jgi:hypothetical protein
MRILPTLLAAALVLGVSAAAAHADPTYYPTNRQAPDACWPGFYAINHCGATYGPNYCLYPSFPPFNGLLPPRQSCGVPISWHCIAHGPRDYFMIDR